MLFLEQDKSSAATPTANGQAIDVPDRKAYQLSGTVENIFPPGDMKSKFFPVLLKSDLLKFESIDPIAIVSG